MKTYSLEREMRVPVSLQETFAFFEDPRNLARITPPWLKFRVTSTAGAQLRKGAEFEYEIRWLGIPLTWKTVIAEYEPPFYFVDEQAAGPYLFWRHEHTFHPSEDGTIVQDRVEYALPLGIFGRIAHGLLVRRQLREIFDYRQAVLGEIFGEVRAR